MILRQKDNFIPRLDILLPEIRKIKLYNLDEFNAKHPNDEQTWPGHRSTYLKDVNLFLYEYINYLLVSNGLLETGMYDMDSYLHLRLDENKDQDWIHQDTQALAALVYISETNLNSGTLLYNENKQVINDIKFVQNRCVVYSGEHYHMGYGHHGTDINNGRLTLNIFAKRK